MDTFVLKNCTTSAPDTREQTALIISKLYFLPITTTKHSRHVARTRPQLCDITHTSLYQFVCLLYIYFEITLVLYCTHGCGTYCKVQPMFVSCTLR